MQHKYGIPVPNFLARPLAWGAAITLCLALSACGPRPTTLDPPSYKPHSGTKIRVAVADPGEKEWVAQLARSWGTRSGAEVQMLDGPTGGPADVTIIPAVDLPRLAAAGQLAALPDFLLDTTHPYRWKDVFAPVRDRLLSWDGVPLGLPVRGEGMVLVYRKAKFDGRDGRPAAPPATWAELLAVAKALGGRPLPPLPASSEQMAAEFLIAAASYDRPAVNRTVQGTGIETSFFDFAFHGSDGTPRLTTPPFMEAAQQIAELAPHRAPNGDAVTAFDSGQAVLGIVSLRELARMKSATVESLGVAPVPGADKTFDQKARTWQAVAQGNVNRVPVVGWDMMVAVVARTCANPQAAWELAADLGIPDQAGLELIARPGLGAGPYRYSQFDSPARPRWFSLGLSPNETDRLVSSLRENLGIGIENGRMAIRTPNRSQLMRALETAIRPAFRGEVPAGRALATAAANWEAIRQADAEAVVNIRRSQAQRPDGK